MLEKYYEASMAPKACLLGANLSLIDFGDSN